MPLAVLPLVLLAAVFHASWNALLKASENPLSLATRAVTWGTAVSLPPVAVAWIVAGRPGLPLGGWLLALASAFLELIYFITLSTAYQRGELSVVYPIARGTAPLLAVLVGLLLFGERLHLFAGLGVLALLAGIWAVRRPATAGSALLPALLTGVMIAAYTSLDRIGVRLGPPWIYGWLLWLFGAIFLIGYTTIRRVPGSRLTDEPKMSLTVGVLMTAAYFMILFALSVAPLAVIAPLRESAIVLVTAWGIWRLGERRGAWIRIAGALAIIAGIALLTVA
ncbi:MAG TPA: DMT family transporter [Candidatus Dormibacteraeota bacterium]|nr:DMT family transporter [Candidatus Dormibacteraeota bacterium]